mmetsp:Transcript_12739/g.23786  ORF Transcript_12739/g.23786 Transcript_12739/m.23786 type:complete len:187 (-) Transcript_12739:328-888(-)
MGMTSNDAFFDRRQQSMQKQPTLWVRPSSHRKHRLYPSLNPALKTDRRYLCRQLKGSAPLSTRCGDNENATSSAKLMTPSDYFQELYKHTFVASPTGRGLDSHATWEALLAGCMVIVPKMENFTNGLFADLPVWTVEDWTAEVNDTSIVQMANKFWDRANQFDWEKIFATGWMREIEHLAYQDDKS